MRRPISRVPSLALALAVAASPLAAQSAAAPAPVRPAAMRAADAPPVVRPVAVYRFTSARRDGLPSEAVVADSAGQVIASFRLPLERAARPMTVAFIGEDIVLQGATPDGVLTLRLRDVSDPATEVVTGEWRLADRSGTLRGRPTR